MLPLFSATHWLSVHGLVALLALFAYVLRSRVTRQRRHPAAAIAWVLFILLLPYAALPAFLVFGSRKLPRPRAVPPLPAGARSDAPPRWLDDTLAALGQRPPAGYRALAVHPDGAGARRALMHLLDGASERLDVCTFILGDDPLGQEVMQALQRRVAAGCRVRLLIDGMGRWMGGRPGLAALRGAGVEVRVFVPPFTSPLRGRTNLRNHRKLVVADAFTPRARLWSGGRNLACEYFEGRAGQPAWRDLSFDLEGPLADDAAALFEHDWCFAGGRAAASGPVAAAPPGGEPQEARAHLLASGPDQADDTLHALLVNAAHRAGSRILLASPYFVPEPEMLQALALAARRGVSVRLLLPARSNHRLSDLARERSLRTLAQAGGQVLLAPAMLHAKLMVFDDQLALAGSANLDGRSLFLNYEVMTAFVQAEPVARFADWFEQEAASARPYALQRPGLLRDTAEGLVLAVGFQL